MCGRVKITAVFLVAVILITGLVGCAEEKNDKQDISEVAEVKDMPKEDVLSEDTDINKNSQEVVDMNKINLPDSPRVFSKELALQMLALCSGYTEEKECNVLEEAGFTVVSQRNYDKEKSDTSHTCAYSIGMKKASYGGTERDLIIVAIRGTQGGEWYSNLDFAPSHSDESSFTENFLFAAESIFLETKSYLDEINNPIVLVCGHSRGGACANLLGMLLNAEPGEKDIFTYTFASPTTFKGTDCGVDCGNIFNIVNPADIVTKMPLEGWGYTRLGKDIILLGDEDKEKDAENWISELLNIAPTVSQYYCERHSLTETGLSEKGVTSFEMLLSIAGGVEKAKGSGNEENINMLSVKNDFSPLFELVKLLSESDDLYNSPLIKEHLPSTYHDLLVKTEA